MSVGSVGRLRRDISEVVAVPIAAAHEYCYPHYLTPGTDTFGEASIVRLLVLS